MKCVAKSRSELQMELQARVAKDFSISPNAVEVPSQLHLSFFRSAASALSFFSAFSFGKRPKAMRPGDARAREGSPEVCVVSCVSPLQTVASFFHYSAHLRSQIMTAYFAKVRHSSFNETWNNNLISGTSIKA